MADNPRLQAVRALVNVIGQKKTLDQTLTGETPPLVRELVSGSLRHYFSLSQRIDELLTKKLRDKDLDVRCLILIGAYQLIHTRIPDHAAVAETVGCTRLLKKPWSKGLVNAVLRNLPNPTEEWSPAAQNDHPNWFIDALRSSLPDHWADVLTANNTKAPMTLRVNRTKISPAAYKKLLQNEKIDFESGALPETLHLQSPRPQKTLPGFNDGLVAVQDSAAQLAVSVANARPGMTVLDACAAPGGKGFHLFEEMHGQPLTLHMNDIAPLRVETLTEQADRLGHRSLSTLHIETRDSAAHDQNTGQKYDLILLDAPCTGSGTVRRHPDIKILRSFADLKAMNTTQNALLDALWNRLASGGRLIYSTCSLFQEENDNIIEGFLARRRMTSEAPPIPPITLGRLAERVPKHPRTPFVSTRCGIQTLPSVDGGDGLYYAEIIATT